MKEDKAKEVKTVDPLPKEKVDQVVKDLEVRKEKNGGMTLQDTLTLGEVLYKSRFFSDVQSAAQAVAKILAGRELGLGPMVSLSKVFVVGGKIAIQAEVMADMIKRGNKYSYHVVDLTNEKCSIDFYEGNKKIGNSVFSIEDARKADVFKGVNWQKYPRNMLFARALSNGARWYCPDAIHGAYTPEEMGIEIDNGVSMQKSDFVIEPEVVSKKEEKPKGRSELIDELKANYGKDKMKEVKEKLKIKERLSEISAEVFQKYRKELEK